jgi:hypothetical protein
MRNTLTFLTDAKVGAIHERRDDVMNLGDTVQAEEASRQGRPPSSAEPASLVHNSER